MDTDFTAHVGEYFALILLAAVGMMFLVSSEDILMIFVSLELTSLSLYILTAFNKRRRQVGGGGAEIFPVRRHVGGVHAVWPEPALRVVRLDQPAGDRGGDSRARDSTRCWSWRIVMTVIGFGFKVAAVPFHLWAPDAYQGAPTPSAAFIASGSKVASFFIFAKVMMLGFPGAEGSGAWHGYVPGWVPVLAVLAALSMVLGNLAAIVQSSVRRLLAYSAIAHAGYMLLGVLAHGRQGLASLIYYVITYGLTTLGAFGVVAVVESRTGGDRLSDFAGLSRRAPVLSFCMMIFMLSLAGIPPLAGFFGKFYVFAAALQRDAAGDGLALAGDSGHRDERGVALLLSAGAEADLCAGGGGSRGSGAQFAADAGGAGNHRAAGGAARVSAATAAGAVERGGIIFHFVACYYCERTR